MIRAVVFDLYNTLVRGGGSRREAVYLEMARTLGVDHQAFVKLFKQTTDQRMRGELGTIEETMRALAGQLGASPNGNSVRLTVLTWQRFHHRILWPSHATLTTLDSLRERGLRLGLLTNCSQETVIQWPSQPMADRFDATVFSCELGTLKPEPASYEAVCAELGVDPRECVFVGDGADNELKGAAAVGMRVFRTLEFAYSDPTWNGATIGKLSEITGRLG
ncbi:MAG TPA: HAD family hydrolase [Micromonosporaceae bacterium]|nr:HAD family hydrolase [Micromonosporaceae bacterium]HCU51203.1 HAD family hydrolase [Micromonosporaceae bacterium]